MNRSDPIALFVVSFFGGLVASGLLIALVDLSPTLQAGVGCLCTAAVAALLYRQQQQRRW